MTDTSARSARVTSTSHDQVQDREQLQDQLIIVMPEGEESYWINHPDGARWGDYVAFDLVAHIDATYRTIREPGGRAIGGLSMGGYGALQLALTHPRIFGAVGAHSPSLRALTEAPAYFGDADDFARHNPFSLARTVDPAIAPRVWLDAGAEDPWLPRVAALDEVLREQGLPVEYHVWPGEHDDPYWSRHVDDYLRFYDAALGGAAAVERAPQLRAHGRAGDQEVGPACELRI